MNRRGERFLTVRQFTSHASSVKVKRLTKWELEFYEQQCLLLPVARTHMPTAHAIALEQKSMGFPVSNPEDLEPPEEWLRLDPGYQDGMHTFDRERDNPLLVIPDCTTFQPWSTDRVDVPNTDDHVWMVKTVERYYAAWQVHIVEQLRCSSFYEREQFLRELPEAHRFRKIYRLPEKTANLRTLRGMAVGYDALTLFGVARRLARHEAFQSVPVGQSLSESASKELDNLLAQRTKRVLRISGVDEPALFRFVNRLTRMIHDYRDDERFALAEDTEQDLWATSWFAYYAFGLEWDGFLAAAENHVGKHLVDRLRRLDPIESTKLDARKNLEVILQDGAGATVSSDSHNHTDTAQAIVDFCLEQDLYEVLTGLQNYSYSLAEQRRDGYPGFLHRRLRPLALAVEQLARGVLDAAGEPHHGKSLTGLIRVIGADSMWMQHFKPLVKERVTWDTQGDLHEKALELARSIETLDGGDYEAIAKTLVCAVATRNLVSHRHKFLSRQEIMTLGGTCAKAVVLVWLLAKDKGLV